MHEWEELSWNILNLKIRKMKGHKDLIKTKEYWLTNFQEDLYAEIEAYMQENNLNRTQLAAQLGVTKGYISQVLNGNFDHRISKLIELVLAIGKVPKLEIIDRDDYLENESSANVSNGQGKIVKTTITEKMAS